jgi:DnaJ-domain-containing protein 1
MEKRIKTDSVMVAQLETVFDSVEAFQRIAKNAVEDSRYKLTLSDSRFMRDTINIIETMLDHAWLDILNIPLELDIEEVRERMRKSMESKVIANRETAEQKALNGRATYKTLEALLSESVIEE